MPTLDRRRHANVEIADAAKQLEELLDELDPAASEATCPPPASITPTTSNEQ